MNLSPFNHYLGLVKGKAIFGYPWAVTQLFSDYLRILKDKCAPVLEWAVSNPPKPHAFTNLCLESGILSTIIRSVVLRVQLDIRQLIINHLTNAILVKTQKKAY